MKMLNLSKGYTLVGFIALLFCTYFRENMLLEINALLSVREYDRSYTYWFVNFFKSIPFEQLVYWKWGVTIFFGGLMPFVTILSLYGWFQNIIYNKILVILYLIGFFFAALIGGVGLLFNCFDSIYFIIRRILGIVQSPVPFFLFFLLFYYLEKSDNTNHCEN